MDEVSIPQKLRDEVYSVFPEAKIAHIKTGGNFPFLSRSDELNVYIEVCFCSFMFVYFSDSFMFVYFFRFIHVLFFSPLFRFI